MNILKRKENLFKSQSHHYNTMSIKTKDFIKKICYRKAASVDMTQYGFIADTKVHPWRVLIKPLKEQLQKICGKPIHSTPQGKQTPAKRIQRTMINSRSRRLPVINKRIKPGYVKDGRKQKETKKNTKRQNEEENIKSS